ncbi:hypothetical protein WMF30_37390 [Sorangium sp. So ce134]
MTGVNRDGRRADVLDPEAGGPARRRDGGEGCPPGKSAAAAERDMRAATAML